MAKRPLTARQVRYLFATGKLSATGKGKNRKVTYHKDGKAKADHGATRAARIAAGRKKAVQFLAQRAVREANRQRNIEHKTMTSRFSGRFKDTGRPFKAGETIRYVPGSGAYENTPRRKLRRALMHEFPDSKFSGIGKAGSDMIRRPRDTGQSKSTTIDRLFDDARSSTRQYLKGGRGDVARARARAPQIRAAYSERRAGIAKELRAARKTSPTLAREGLLKFKTDKRFKKILRNPNRK